MCVSGGIKEGTQQPEFWGAAENGTHETLCGGRHLSEPHWSLLSGVHVAV